MSIKRRIKNKNKIIVQERGLLPNKRISLFVKSIH